MRKRNKAIFASVGGAAMLAISVGACSGGTTTVVRVPTPAVTKTVTAKPAPVKTAPIKTAPVKPAPVASTPAPVKPAPVASTPAPSDPYSANQQGNAGADTGGGVVYCTYERMLVADCTNGGYVTITNSAYNQALAQNPNDPGANLSGDYPISEVIGASAPAATSYDPWTVVSGYYADIESGDYSDAWNQQSYITTGYNAWVAGYADTSSSVSENSESGDTVSIDLEADANGVSQSFTCSYTVDQDSGTITAGYCTQN
jgi:hypothetical protein